MSTIRPAINIQFPITEEILCGRKTIETRTYSIPAAYQNIALWIVETPGHLGDFQSRVVGEIVFGNCFLYSSSEAFYADFHRHFVKPESPWAWIDKKPKWGWEIISVKRFKAPKKPGGRRGIVFTKSLELKA